MMPVGLKPRGLARRAVWGIWATGGLSGCFASGLDSPARLDYQARSAPTLPAATPTPPAATQTTSRGQADTPVVVPSVQPAGAQLPQPRAVDAARPLDVPPGLPGSDTPHLNVPPDRPETRAERLKVIDALFPEMPPLAPDPVVDGMPGVRAATLDDLLEFARKNSPAIAQATADVEDARGKWIQVGLYPNPSIGFQGDQIADGGPFGQFGGYWNQPIVTAGKLKVARSVIFFDLVNARIKLRRAEVDLARQVRANYYAVLVAAESVRVGRTVVQFTHEVYRRQVALVKGGTAAPFEASALLAVTGQAELILIQARNRYTSAWKQLAASINAPNMPSAPLAGRVDETLPRYGYEALKERLLAIHPDLVAARNSVTQAERSLLQERIKPIPDIQNNWYFEQDTLLNNFQFGTQIGVAVPIFNRNQGGILSAKALLGKANWEVPRVQNDLLRQLADAFERYEVARQQVAVYRDQIMPSLVTAFRGVYQRYQVEPDKVNYNDIVNAQQNLSVQLSGYLQALQQQWLAVADLAGVVQAIDLAELPRSTPGPTPDEWPDASPRAFVAPPVPGEPAPKKP